GKSIEDVSTADVLDPITNEVIGTLVTFLDGDNNPVGSPLTVLNGKDGIDGIDGKSAYELAVEDGFTGNVTDWLESLNGQDGADGKSAYDIWEEIPSNENGTEQDFIDSLKGEDG